MTIPLELPNTRPEEPRIPGVRYRTEVRERLVPQTIDGETRMVPVPYETAVPVPPRDWDRFLLRAVTGAAVAATAVSVAWTTAGIGALLAPVGPHPIAYFAAGIFDVAWLACQAVEWLERYDQERAHPARAAGRLALLIAVGAIIAHGVTSGDTVAGGVRAAVPLIAKGLWVIVLRHYAVPLGPRVGGWLLQRRREVAAHRALAMELRRLDAHEAYAAAAFGNTASTAQQALANAEVPRASAAEVISEQAPPSASPPMPGGEEPVGNVVRSLSSDRASIADTIRTCLSAGITSDIEIVDRVRDVHGDRPNLVDTVARTRRRIDSRNAPSPMRLF